MSGRWRLAVAAAPGLALVLAALAGLSPTARDLRNYFVPLRQRTAAVVRGARGPYWNPDVGCGEPFFANPQSALLYPPAWFALVVPARAAVGVETGVHLALLALGGALLARRLGARGWFDVAAAWALCAAGPVLDAAGVLNNLDSLAWAPWVWNAALAGDVAGGAAFLALAYLAAEPSLAVVTGLIALVIAPRRRTVAAVALAVALVAVQALPFAAWVRGGDRGAGRVPDLGMAGIVFPVELAAMAAPGVPRPAYAGVPFVPHLGVPMWALALGAVAAFDRRAAVRRLALAGWVLIGVSTLPALPGGLAVWNAATRGFIRYSGRFLFPAMAALIPAAAAAATSRRVRLWQAAAGASLVAVGGVLIGGSPGPTVAGAATTAAVLAAVVPAPAAALGATALLGQARDALALGRVHEPRPALCLAAQRAARRLYVVAPSEQQLNYAAVDPLRMRSLALGYSALGDGRHTARTFAPLESSRLAGHLARADVGPAGTWWLDALGADRIVSQHPIPGFTQVCGEDGLIVYDNPGAWPLATVARAVPQPGQTPRWCGTATAVLVRDDARSWRTNVTGPGAVFLWAETPDPGWKFRVDGTPAPTVAGPGILHGVAVGAGDHTVSARYRPPGLMTGAVISAVGLCLVLGVAWRRW